MAVKASYGTHKKIFNKVRDAQTISAERNREEGLRGS
jgi:hypothetical protein